MNGMKRYLVSFGVAIFALAALFALYSGPVSTPQVDAAMLIPTDPGILQPVDPIEPQQPDYVLVVTPAAATINVGESQQYQAFVSSDGGTTLGDEVTNDENCTWSIDDPAIATLGDPGLVTGVAAGGTTVRAEYYGRLAPYGFITITGGAKLNVEGSAPQDKLWLEVEPDTATIEVGDSQQYRAYLHTSAGGDPLEVTDNSQWSIDEDIATSTGKGKYRGDREGTTDVTASYEYLSDDAELIVVRRPDIPDIPETEDLPEGKMLDRQPGYITLSEPKDLGNPGAEFTLNYDQTLMDSNPDRYPKVFYWNKSYEKWVALASYPQSPGVIKAQNDGNYSGWFVVFGCIQPRWNDITSEWLWAEPIANRMNGLGLLEGYPDPANPTALVRPAGISRTITRAELTAFVARILGLAPGDTHLYPTITYLSDAQNTVILNAAYSDAASIPAWSRPYIAAMTNAGLVNGKGDGFAPNDQMTRIEAAVLISNALKDVPGFGYPADLTVYTDADQIPSWAIGKVSEGTIGGYPDGSLRPNQPINRAESMVLLLKLLRGLGW